MLTMAIDSGDGSDLRYDLAKEVVSIGASSSNDVVLRSPGVAPVHIVIRRSGDSYTFFGQPRQIVLLNGTRRSRGVLNEGDRLRIGTATLLILAADVSPFESVKVGTVEEPKTEEAADSRAAAEEEPKSRAEVVLYNEPPRLALARRQLLDVFRNGLHSDLVAALQVFFETVFKKRRAVLAWLDQQGELQPIVSNWSGALPQLPPRTFAELDNGDRVAVLRSGGSEVLIYPLILGEAVSRVFLLAETSDENCDEDRTLLAELAAMISVHWRRVAGASELLGFPRICPCAHAG